MTKETEKDIIQKILSGQTDAFAELVDRYRDPAFTLCVRICGNREDAADVCQEAFVKAFHSLKNFRGDACFSTWLYRIMYNASVSFLRKKKNNRLVLDEGRLPELPDTETENNWDAEENELKQRLVKECMDELPSLDKSLLTLYYLLEHPVSDIAEITGLSETNAKVRLHRARLKLFEMVTAKMKVQII